MVELGPKGRVGSRQETKGNGLQVSVKVSADAGVF